jgi:hypothetical protein
MIMRRNFHFRSRAQLDGKAADLAGARDVSGWSETADFASVRAIGFLKFFILVFQNTPRSPQGSKSSLKGLVLLALLTLLFFTPKGL